jgi:hypothetical protein
MRTGLIGLITCERDKSWLAACRDTWLKDVMPDFDVFVADGSILPKSVPDSYESLPYKTKELCRYALKHSYRWLIKVDCDSFARPKFFKPPYDSDYAGRLRGKSAPEAVPEGVLNECNFCSGGAYWLSSRAMQIVVQSPITKDFAEDRWVGNTLFGYGIHANHLAGYIAPTCWPPDKYANDPGLVVLMQLRDGREPQNAERMRRMYAGIYEPPAPPVGSRAEDYPEGHPLRMQMAKK